MEKQDTECEEILISYTHLTKDLCPKYIKSSYQKNFFFQKIFFQLKNNKNNWAPQPRKYTDSK